jgi:hypothetical protein
MLLFCICIHVFDCVFVCIDQSTSLHAAEYRRLLLGHQARTDVTGKHDLDVSTEVGDVVSLCRDVSSFLFDALVMLLLPASHV